MEREVKMRKIRFGIVLLWMLVCAAGSAEAQVSIGIGLPNLSIGINLPLFPELVPVPGYPVYYAPHLDANYFFYDGMYWVFMDGNWYASSWYNGPWALVDPYYLPLFILRIPVRYYRHPPAYFRGWRADAPPRWGKHWGRDWEKRRKGWSRWDRRRAPKPAPLPVYQRQYSRDRYPGVEQQHRLRSQHYRYQPRERLNRRHYGLPEKRAPAPVRREQRDRPAVKSPGRPDIQRPAPTRQGGPAPERRQPANRSGDSIRRSTPAQPLPQQQAPVLREQRRSEREQRAPEPRGRKEERGGEKEERGREHKDRGR